MKNRSSSHADVQVVHYSNTFNAEETIVDATAKNRSLLLKKWSALSSKSVELLCQPIR